MRDSGIVADEEMAAREDSSQLRQRRIRHSNQTWRYPRAISRSMKCPKWLDDIAIGRPFDEEERAI